MREVVARLTKMGGTQTNRIVILDCCFADALMQSLDKGNYAGKF
jgi:hypothetical protein